MDIRPTRNDRDLADAGAIRTRVFVQEQACPPELEWDEHEETSRHLVGYVDEAPVAAARWRVVRVDGKPAAKLERFAVLPAYRGRGLGRRMVDFALDDARQAGFETFVLHAQAHLESFYGSFGFERVGDRFDEAGIEHIRMIKRDRP